MNFELMKKRLSFLDTASIADANKRIRVVDPQIKPVRLGLKMIGKAHTIRCKDDFLTVIKGLSESGSDEVLVIDTCGSRTAMAGELFSMESFRRGLAGIVIDGACRDTAKIRTLNLPVYSRSVIPVSGTTSNVFETQVPITCGGVIINPEDILFGDDDGIVVGSASEFTEIIPIAEEIQAKEERILKRLEAGENLLDLLNFDEHFQNIKDGKESKLGFKL